MAWYKNGASSRLRKVQLWPSVRTDFRGLSTQEAQWRRRRSCFFAGACSDGPAGGGVASRWVCCAGPRPRPAYPRPRPRALRPGAASARPPPPPAPADKRMHPIFFIEFVLSASVRTYLLVGRNPLGARVRSPRDLLGAVLLDGPPPHPGSWAPKFLAMPACVVCVRALTTPPAPPKPALSPPPVPPRAALPPRRPPRVPPPAATHAPPSSLPTAGQLLFRHRGQRGGELQPAAAVPAA